MDRYKIRTDGINTDTVRVVPIKISLHGMPMPEQHGDWIDLTTAEDVHMSFGELRNISLGVSMEMPEGYYGELLPRSSTASRYGVFMANSMGIIDNQYCGENDIWCFPAVCFVTNTHIPKGSRIAQFRVVRSASPIEFECVEKLSGEDRGGFGSTGV